MLKLVLMLKNTEIKTIETDKETNGSYVIEDLNSTNGTLLNNEPITKAGLTGKDVITIGKHTLFVSVQKGQIATQGMTEATIKIAP